MDNLLSNSSFTSYNSSSELSEDSSVWQPYYQDALTSNDLLDIRNNMIGCMNLVMSWRQAEEKESTPRIQEGEI